MPLTAKWYLDDTADSSPPVLCDTGDLLGELRFNGQQLVDVRQGVRAASSRPVNRRNVTNRVSFVVAIAPKASVALAEAACADLAAAIVTACATKNFLYLDRSGDALQLHDAAIETWEIWHLGVTVFVRFSFLGGLLDSN